MVVAHRLARFVIVSCGGCSDNVLSGSPRNGSPAAVGSLPMKNARTTSVRWGKAMKRMPNGTFSTVSWVNLNYTGTGTTALTSSNSVCGDHAVGIVTGTGEFAFQASVHVMP